MVAAAAVFVFIEGSRVAKLVVLAAGSRGAEVLVEGSRGLEVLVIGSDEVEDEMGRGVVVLSS